ncbi:hypothetical protein ASPACDRAFT_63299 [Aspergillus aculeatus ATCC 16872]|uniref:Uncharacterized protein n=1 Tax=Aspergillus aculeatus (strain ATCC 16872 / CBS 172.66 / WB 5094) TaxID=690307 RepID=A0A1L9WLG0_ASPA1|nr:uncharacterized protein ASPACDRAFT_63299 [Aspergillus aculeatus ATCC 16872]OJJ96992.1 hypothetical protein ASPACDRAFT_63299 [Aspergillus aculeatus ATCC 16872]
MPVRSNGNFNGASRPSWISWWGVSGIASRQADVVFERDIRSVTHRVRSHDGKVIPGNRFPAVECREGRSRGDDIVALARIGGETDRAGVRSEFFGIDDLMQESTPDLIDFRTERPELPFLGVVPQDSATDRQCQLTARVRAGEKNHAADAFQFQAPTFPDHTGQIALHHQSALAVAHQQKTIQVSGFGSQESAKTGCNGV